MCETKRSLGVRFPQIPHVGASGSLHEGAQLRLQVGAEIQPELYSLSLGALPTWRWDTSFKGPKFTCQAWSWAFGLGVGEQWGLRRITSGVQDTLLCITTRTGASGGMFFQGLCLDGTRVKEFRAMHSSKRICSDKSLISPRRLHRQSGPWMKLERVGDSEYLSISLLSIKTPCCILAPLHPHPTLLRHQLQTCPLSKPTKQAQKPPSVH